MIVADCCKLHGKHIVMLQSSALWIDTICPDWHFAYTEPANVWPMNSNYQRYYLQIVSSLEFMEGQFPFVNPRGRTKLRGTFEVVRSFRQEIWWIIQYGLWRLWVCLKIGYPQFQWIIIIIIVPISYYICYLWASPIFKQTHIAVLPVNFGVIRPICYSSQSCTALYKWTRSMLQNDQPMSKFQEPLYFSFMPCPNLCNVNPGVADDDPINQLGPGFPKFTNPGFTLGLRARGDPKSCSKWDESERKDVFLFECLRSLPATTTDFPSRLWEIVILFHPFCQPVSNVDWLRVAMY